MLRKHLVIILSAASLAACGGGSTTEKTETKLPAPPAKPAGAVIEVKAPLGLPAVPVPADNPITAETVALGRRLYYDKNLSSDGTISCASCHDPEKGFSDGSPNSTGVAGKHGARNAPTVWNAAYSPVQFWDGRAPDLERQAVGPMANPVEMAHTLDGVVGKVNGDATYKADIEKAWGPGPVNIDQIAKSIAAFERTVLTGNSPFDKYMFGGDKKALSASAIRGLEVFQDKEKGNCAACHTIDKTFALFTDGKFHNIGVGVDKKGELTDLGRYNETKVEADKGAFKTPTLRNIAQTAPYMHDGSLKTLKDVVDFYVGGGSSNDQLDKEIKNLKLSQSQRADLIAFLESLTGETPANIGPPAGGK